MNLDDEKRRLSRASWLVRKTMLKEQDDDLTGNLPDERIDAPWAREAEDRIAAYEAGEMQAIPSEEVFSEIGDEHDG